VRTSKQRCGTSPSKVYPKSEPIADFLLDERSVELNPKISKVCDWSCSVLDDVAAIRKAAGRLGVDRERLQS